MADLNIIASLRPVKRLRPSRVGERYGMLTIIEEMGSRYYPNGAQVFYVKARCDCGKEKIIVYQSMRRGRSQSCGCQVILRSKERMTKHGEYKSAEYMIWQAMHNRCRHHVRWAGRGIQVCSRWDDFPAFLNDMGRRPSPKHTLDRIDNDGNYTLFNCRWALPVVQQNNTRAVVNITFAGKTQSISRWSRELGVSAKTLAWRLKRWPLDQVMGSVKRKNRHA